MRLVTILIFFIVASNTAVATTHIDVLNENIFDGNWSELQTTAGDHCICEYPGTLYVISSLGSGHDHKDRMCYSVSVCEFYDCVLDDCGRFGSTTGCQVGGWISMMPCKFLMSDHVWNRQTTEEHNVMNNSSKFLGVCPSGWKPYMGDPSMESTVQNHKHIWADPVIRFDNESMINGRMYVDSIKSIHIDENVWHSVDEIDSKKSCKKCDPWHPYFDSINVTNHSTIEGDTVTATIDIKLKWYYYHRDCHITGDDIVCYDVFKNTTETASFVVSAPMPEVIDPSMIGNISAEIMMYNNTFQPYTLIHVDVPENVTITSYNYRNCTANHFRKMGWIENGTHIVQYLNESLWKESPNQNLITHIDELCVIREAPLNFSDLHITVSSPYETVNVTNYSITMMNSKPTDYIDFKRLLLYTMTICIPLWGIIVNVKRWTR